MTLAQTLQFAATFTVTQWQVDGVAGGSAAVGTISAGGLYQPPAAVGTHSVTAVGAGQAASVPLFVTDPPAVATCHYDKARSGVNARETVLTPTRLSGRFERQFSLAVDGQVYAQPLYVPNLAMPGVGLRNVVFVATEADSVYAFDADGSTVAPLWTRHLADAAQGVVPLTDLQVQSNDITPQIGITGTPVIDPIAQTLYVVTVASELGKPVQRLHALSLLTGQPRVPSVVIAGQVAGTGSASQGGQVAFDALLANQRAGLLLSNGTVYVAWASHGDVGPYHGWVMGFDAATLNRVSVFTSTPNGDEGGIWMSGGGIAADANNQLYLSVGNGAFDAGSGGSDYADSVLRLDAALAVQDYFTPQDQQQLSLADQDLGSTATLILPDQGGAVPHLALAGGKAGTLYLLNRDQLGHISPFPQDPQIVGEIAQATAGKCFSSPTFFAGRAYLQGASDFLRAFALGTTGAAPRLALGAQGSRTAGFPGTQPIVSANGTQDGIVWTLQVDGFAAGRPAVLLAYDPVTLTVLYDSGQSAGAAVKFTVPTVANGRVYVGTQTEVSVFGLQR